MKQKNTNSFKDELLSKLDTFNDVENCELTQHQMNNIYSSISNNSINFNEIDFRERIFSFIEEVFDENFKKIDSEVLQKNQILINDKFIILLKKSVKNNIKSVGLNFIYFCEYFCLDFNKTYLLMPSIIKTHIELSCKKMIGSDNYRKHKLKANCGVHINSFLDIKKQKSNG